MKQYPIKSYAWSQVSQHNKKDDCWVIHKQKVYDITKFLPVHPGGFEMIFLGAGRDITYLLQSYHLWSDKPEVVLKKYLIGELVGEPEFTNFKEDSGFYKELVEKVKHYFEKTGKDPKNPVPGLIRLIGFFAIALVSYFACFVWELNWWAKVGFAVLYGVAQALPLLHCMHDASHTSIGSTPTMWSWISHLTMDLFAGASINSWMHQHVLSHHLYTNIHKADGDLPLSSTGDIRRIVPSQVWVFIYKFQWLYLPFLYSLLALKFRVQDILDTLIRKKNGPLKVGNVTNGKIVEQIIAKSLFVCWRILLPIIYLNVPIKDLAFLFLISELVTGWYLAFNFQVSHVSTQADFHELATADEWAVLQVNTSVDYGHGSWMIAFLSGALNYQTVHHLFPAISQYHYPALAPIVMEVCKKHGLKYNVLDGFGQAFKEHLVYLYELGNQLDKKTN